MNNIKKKNVIYGYDRKDTLPHQGDGSSLTLRSNSNITDARINNVFQQLINNDLYLENKMKIGMNYQPGPYAVKDEEVENLPNGAKRWVDQSDYSQPLRILRKLDYPLSSNIGTPIRQTAVNFIAPIGDTVFVAFRDKLMYDTDNGLVDCTADGESIAATGYCDGDGGTFFSSDTSVYELKRSSDETYYLSKIDIGSFSGIKSVQYDISNDTLYIGGTHLFARGKYRRN